MKFRSWVIPTSIGVTSFGLGVSVGYLFSRNRIGKLEAKIDIIQDKLGDVNTNVDELHSDNNQLEFRFEAEREEFMGALQQASHVLDKFKEHGRTILKYEEYSRKGKEPYKQTRPTNDLVNMENEFVETLKDEVPLSSVFLHEDTPWDYDVEVPKRTKEAPYIIHRDEFFNHEADYYSQTTLTYYAGDNILCDELDVPIPNADKLVGKLEFGKGSEDRSIVYIRNDHLEAEYEVILDHGYFQVEVLGVQMEEDLNQKDLKHSLHKFRLE
ncbi:MAG: hypothetical protein ABWY25_09640 [Paenisporosarcina sp.]